MWGSGGVAPRFNFGTRWGWVVSLHPGHLTPITHLTGGWLALIASLDTVVKWKNPCPCQNLNPSHATCSSATVLTGLPQLLEHILTDIYNCNIFHIHETSCSGIFLHWGHSRTPWFKIFSHIEIISQHHLLELVATVPALTELAHLECNWSSSTLWYVCWSTSLVFCIHAFYTHSKYGIVNSGM